MELQHLRTFVAVAEHGRLSRAAQALHASQPALSAHLSSLEQELGVALFARSTQGMALTPAAERLLPLAKASLAAAQSMCDQARHLAGELTGTVEVGTVTDPVWLRVPGVLAHLSGHHPGLAVELHHSTSPEVIGHVAEGRWAAGWVVGEVDDPRLSSRTLTPVGLRVAGPAAWEERIRTADLAGLCALPWVATPPDCPFGVVMDRLFAPLGRRPETRIQAAQEGWLQALAVGGIACCILREEMALAGEAAGALALWPGPLPATHLRFVVPANRVDDPVTLALAEAAAAPWRTEASSCPRI